MQRDRSVVGHDGSSEENRRIKNHRVVVSRIFFCSSLFGEMIQFDDCAYFSDGLVQPLDQEGISSNSVGS